MILHGQIKTGSDWWFAKILLIRTGSDSILSDQDWARTEKFNSPHISGTYTQSQAAWIVEYRWRAAKLRNFKLKIHFHGIKENKERILCQAARGTSLKMRVCLSWSFIIRRCVLAQLNIHTGPIWPMGCRFPIPELVFFTQNNSIAKQ